MAWISSSRQLSDVIYHALFLQPSNDEQKQLRASADQQLCQWKKDAMNFGDCASELVAAPFNFQGRGENPFYGCSAPNTGSNSNNNNQVSLALSAALMIDDVASPQKWIEAQVFSDKAQVVSLIHRVAFYARPYEDHHQYNNSPPSPASVFEIPNVHKVALNRTSLAPEHKVAKICLNALAGMTVAEFPNSNWINFIYAVSKTTKTANSSSSQSNSANHSKSGSPNNLNTPITNNNNGNENNEFPASNNNHISSTVHDVPLSRRYLWMYFVAQRLASLPTADAFTEEKIGLRLALLDFLENAMRNFSSSSTTTSQEEVEELILQWKIARILLLQLPASKRGDFPVVRSLVSEAGRRIFSCLEEDPNNSTFCMVNLSWQNINAMTVVRDQLLMLKAAPANMVAGSLVRLLMNSVIISTSPSSSHNNSNNIKNQLPGPLWKTAFEVLLSLLEKFVDSEERLQEFSETCVPLQILVRLAAHALTIAPGGDEVFAVPRHKAMLSSDEVNDDDLEEICSHEDFSSSPKLMKWRPIVDDYYYSSSNHQTSRNLVNFYGGDDDGDDDSSLFTNEYFAAREQSMVNDVKEIDSAVIGSSSGSLSACCVALIELLVEHAPQETSNLIGQVVATELLPYDFSSNNHDDHQQNFLLLGNVHGVCTLFLAAFRVFNMNGGSLSFSKAVRNQQDAAMLLERLMNICLGLIEVVLLSSNNNTTNTQNTNVGNNNNNHWDTVHAISRLLIVGCILCEGGYTNDETNMNKFVDDICLKLLLSTTPTSSSSSSSNLVLLHSSAIYCLFRLSIRSPSIRSRVTRTLFQEPEKIPIFVKILMPSTNNSKNNNNNHVEEQIPFSCFAIAELTSTVMSMSSPDYVNHMWQSQPFFCGFLLTLVTTLLKGSLQVSGVIVSQSLKKILDLLISDHGDTRRNCCMQIQCILDPVLNILFNNNSNNQQQEGGLLSSSPAARIICGVLKDLIMNNMMLFNNQNEEESSSNNNTMSDGRCSCVSRYFHQFLLLTQSVAIAESEGHPSDANVRFGANCIAVICAFITLNHNQQQSSSSSIILAADLMFRQISLYQKVLPVSSSLGQTTINNKLSSRTISCWGFASAFCITTLGGNVLNHPKATNTDSLTALAQGIISQTCSFLRLSTKDSDLVGVCFLFSKIGRVNPDAVTNAMKNVSARDASLFWSLWCTIACETTNQRDFGATEDLWNFWNNNQQQQQQQQQNSSNNNNAINLSAQLPIYVLQPGLTGGSRKTSKNSIVADDFARNGKQLSCPAEAIAFVQDFRSNSPQFKSLRHQNRSGVMFEEACFSKLF